MAMSLLVQQERNVVLGSDDQRKLLNSSRGTDETLIARSRVGHDMLVWFASLQRSVDEDKRLVVRFLLAGHFRD